MLQRITAALALLMALACVSAWAADPARFRLTPALLDRMQAATDEVNKLPPVPDKSKRKNGDSDEDDGDDAESVEDIARKLDAQPQVRAVLARHGLTSREYATATLAALHAGMVLAVEKAPGAKLPPDLTPEQRANIDLLRARQKGRK